MLKFHITTTGVELEYAVKQGANAKWVWNDLATNNETRISRVFSFKNADLLNPPVTTQDFDT